MILIEKEIVSPFKTNCYFVYKDNIGVIIDPGGDCHKIKRKMEELKNVNFKYVLNTHGHEDHTFCDYFLKEEYNMKIFIHENDAFFISNNAYNKKYLPHFKDVEIDKFLKDKDEIDLDVFKIKVFHTEGHTPGSSMFIIEDKIFSGDTIFKGAIGRTDFEYSSNIKMKNSIIKILNNLDYSFEIYPGHGSKTKLIDEIENLNYFLEIL
jgi:glyoxylase-like metal-dependent hydrolase (beta-lactamase superfamily II)